MAILDKIEIRIRSNGEILTEYDDPDKDAPYDASTATKFIEATPGARFSIEVSIMAGYNFHGADGVRVSRRMDGQSCIGDFLSKKTSGGSATQALITHVDSETRFDEKVGQWKKSSFRVGQLDILEHSELPEDLDVQMAMQLGTIELSCSRVHRKQLQVPQAWSKTAGLTSVDQTSEKILKGKAIENNIRYVDEQVVPPLSARKHKSITMAGPYGSPLVFRFYYRSHRALQILGCIPRSESPAIVIQDDEEAETKPVPATSDPDNTELEISQRAEEIERLQAELAKLRRLDHAARGIKAETGHNEDTSVGHNTMPSLKRELGENNVRIKREESGSRKRSRTSGPIETVDLTAD